VELIIAGDFNWHDQLWGGVVGLPDHQGEAAPIIELMAELDLQTPNPRGERTWYSHDYRFSSTVDIVLATPEFMNDIYRCTIDGTKHRCDHLAIRTEMAVEWESPGIQPRKL